MKLYFAGQRRSVHRKERNSYGQLVHQVAVCVAQGKRIKDPGNLQ